MARINVQKTYKLFIGGKFPRTESGRSYQIQTSEGALIANMCLASRKDVRNAVVAARKAQAGWAGKTAYNRAQILYRLAEMLEGRTAQFVEELISLGRSKQQAQQEVEQSVDALVYFAGWCDKYTALFSSVNPTASAHFNFSVHEPTGVVTALAPTGAPLLGVVQTMAAVICGGNTVVMLASEMEATCAMSFAEVIQNSDVPGGVVNILSGSAKELVPHMISHMDVNAFAYAQEVALDQLLLAKQNVKRLANWTKRWKKAEPYLILDLQEVKTTWHPIQQSAASGGGY